MVSQSQPCVARAPISRADIEAEPSGLARVTSLSAPPVVGRFYIVPTVRWRWGHVAARSWPVFLPRHTDARFINFPDEHYHIDPRFLNQRERAAVQGMGGAGYLLATLQRYPLASQTYGPPEWRGDPPAAPVWRRKRCSSTETAYQFGHREPITRLQAHYAGEQCRRNRAGWVCPHQSWPMGSLAPDEQGVITCPLHGLRVRAADGRVLSSEALSRSQDGRGPVRALSAPDDQIPSPPPTPEDSKP